MLEGRGMELISRVVFIAGVCFLAYVSVKQIEDLIIYVL